MHDQNYSTEKKNQESFKVQSVKKKRYVNLNEDICLALSSDALKVYCILRLESDFNLNCSPVDRNIQFISNKTTISKRKISDCFDELETYGLLLRKFNPGYQSTYLIADELNYLNKDSVVQNMHDPMQNMHDIYINLFNNLFMFIYNNYPGDENSNSNSKPKQKIKPLEYLETYYQTETQELITVTQDGYQLTKPELDTFDAFKKIYPRKDCSFDMARAQWFHDGCHLNATEIISKLKEQIKKDSKFLAGCIPYPHNYLLKRCYEHEIFEKKKSHFDHEDTSWTELKDIFD